MTVMPTSTSKTAESKPAIETHMITPPTMRHMHGALRTHGIVNDDSVYAYLTALLGREIKSRKDLTEADGRQVIEDCAEAASFTNPGGHPSLRVALLSVQAALPKVARSHTASVPMKAGGSYSYTYADLNDCVDAVIPLLTANGIAWTCLPRLTPSGGYELVGVLMHPSGDREEGALPLFGRQAQDLGSSITYARRYLLGCMTGLVTDDDEDGALAAAAERRAEQQPPPYTGPSTMQLLDRLAELAIEEGTTEEIVSAKWREKHGGMPVEALGSVDPWDLRPLIDAIETWRQNPRNPKSPNHVNPDAVKPAENGANT